MPASLIKFSIVALLIGWIAYTIQWHDALVELGPDGEILSEIAGSIAGPWDAATVEFTADDGQVLVVRPGGDSRRHVVPGILTYFRHADLGLIAAGSLCYLLAICVGAVRWWWLLRVQKIAASIPAALKYTWIGVFFNNIVPGQTGGDLVKALYVARRYHEDRIAAMLSVIVDRLLGLFSLIILGAVVVAFYLDRFKPLALSIWLVCLVVALGGALVLSGRIRRRLGQSTLFRRLPGRLRDILSTINRAVQVYRDNKGGLLAWMLVGIANHSMSAVGVYFLGAALGVGVPAGQYLVLVPVILTISAIPIAPNGWGVGEALFGELFARFTTEYAGDLPDGETVMRTRGVALSLVYRIQTIFWSLLGGILAVTETKIKREEAAVG